MQTPDLEMLHMLIGVLIFIGACFIIAYLFFARQSSYLMYLGIAFFGVALYIITSGTLRWLVIAVLAFAIVMSFIEMGRDIRQRVEILRREEREHEEAFAELQMALIEKERKEGRVGEQR